MINTSSSCGMGAIPMNPEFFFCYCSSSTNGEEYKLRMSSLSNQPKYFLFIELFQNLLLISWKSTKIAQITPNSHWDLIKCLWAFELYQLVTAIIANFWTNSFEISNKAAAGGSHRISRKYSPQSCQRYYPGNLNLSIYLHKCEVISKAYKWHEMPWSPKNSLETGKLLG